MDHAIFSCKYVRIKFAQKSTIFYPDISERASGQTTPTRQTMVARIHKRSSSSLRALRAFCDRSLSKARKLVQSIRRERARGKNGYCKQQSYCSNDRSHLARIIRALLLPARLYAHLVFGFARGPCIILHACALLVAAYLAAVQRGRRLLGKRHSAAEKQQGSET